MQSKKAQAQIIVTVLIILLVIAAVVIVAGVIMNFLEEKGGEIGEKTECLDVNLEVTQAEASAVNGTSTVIVRNSGQLPVTAIQLYVNGESKGSPSSSVAVLATTSFTNIILVSDDEVEAAATIDVEGETVNCGIKSSKTVA